MSRQLWIGLISLCMAGAAVYGIYQLQVKQLSMQESTAVVVPARFVEAGNILTASMLNYQSVAKSAVSEQMVLEKEAILGLSAMIPLGEGEPVLSWKLDAQGWMPKHGEQVFRIPQQYILAAADGLKAGDWVRLYISTAEGGAKTLFERPIRIASIQSSWSRDGLNRTGHNLLPQRPDPQESVYHARQNRLTDIEHLNLILTGEEWLMLDRMCSLEKAKLVVALGPQTLNRK